MKDYILRDYTCKCGAVNEVELRTKGAQIGLYCKKCGNWIKWVTKEEAYTIKHRFEKQESKNVELPDELIINGVTYVRKKEND
ncbi:MAG: hypothetical protein J1E81_06060 [Eubacterium sp.]|nr:hypothetical protein [Eubacterium sp.]